MQQIFRRTHMPPWVFSCKFVAYFQIFKIFQRTCTLNFLTITAWGSIKNSEAKFHNSSNLGLKQRLPKWSFSESFSSGLDQALSKVESFSNSSNSELKQKCSKWNLTEISARGLTKQFQSETFLKVKLYLSSPGLSSSFSQVRFGYNSNSGPYN